MKKTVIFRLFGLQNLRIIVLLDVFTLVFFSAELHTWFHTFSAFELRLREQICKQPFLFWPHLLIHSDLAIYNG